MNDKERWLGIIDALRDTIKVLPDDVTICSIAERGVGQERHIVLQIMENPAIMADYSEPMDEDIYGGDKWCEAIYPVSVGWIEEAKRNDDDE